jgi:hypothetical protein
MSLQGPLGALPCCQLVEHIKPYVVTGVLIFVSGISQTNHQKFHAGR